MGLIQALGAEFRTAAGTLAAPASGSSLGRVVSVDLDPAKKALGSVILEAWCDVLSPLLGPSGAARLFGPQKGAKPEAVERLEKGMASYASLLEKSAGRPLKNLPGAGAAGGLGLGLAALGGDLRSGFDAVADAVGLELKIRDCDAVIAGEGRLDASTREGKAPWGVLQMARRLRKPSYVLAGSILEFGGGWAGAGALFNGPVEPADPRLQDLESRWDEAVRRLLELLPP
jgi:glycerate kinase